MPVFNVGDVEPDLALAQPDVGHAVAGYSSGRKIRQRTGVPPRCAGMRELQGASAWSLPRNEVADAAAALPDGYRQALQAFQRRTVSR
jgi:hypothetical protein